MDRKDLQSFQASQLLKVSFLTENSTLNFGLRLLDLLYMISSIKKGQQKL